MSALPLGIGVRVFVHDPNAPFYGSSGKIIGLGRGMKDGPYKVWMVKIDGLGESGVAHYEKELRHEQ